VIVKDGTCEVGKGQHEAPTMSLGADSQDYKDIVTGRLDAMAAFMQQKVQLQGDLNLAMKFAQIFKFTK
jgi:putative sterol carrier protein